MKSQLSKTGSLIALTLLTVFLLGAAKLSAKQQGTGSPGADVEQLPLKLGSWEGTASVGMDLRSREILQLDSYVIRTYKKNDKAVEVYIGYWSHQTGDHQAAKHSPTVCLPANGWEATSLGTHTLNFPAASGPKDHYVKMLLGKNRNARFLFNYWFFSGEKVYTDDWKALIYISLENLFHGRSDGGIVEVRIPLNENDGKSSTPEEAQAILDDFFQAFVPALEQITHSGYAS